MQNKNQKQINFSLLYIILTAADFLYTIYNLIRYLLNSDFKVSQIFISLFTEFLSLLPLIAFIILSKKLEHIKDLKTCIKIKNYVLLYIIACIFLGIIYCLLSNHSGISFPLSPFYIFYSCKWLFCISYIIKYQMFRLFIPLIFDIYFWVISILFVKNLTNKFNDEQIFDLENGTTSTGYKISIASIIILSIQTITNITLAIAMHENLSNTTGEHAIGTAFFALILIALKLFLDFILLPAIPVSIVGIVCCSSKKEIEQNRKNRRLGKWINIICLVIAALQLLFLW